MADPSLLQIAGGGLVGSCLTYGLTWWRERKRMADAYRAPQREAIGGILAATHELLLAEGDFRDAIGELAKEARGERFRPFTDEQLDRLTREFNRTALGVDRAFQVGRLTIVEAACYEKMGTAYNRFVQIKDAFGDILADQMESNIGVAAERLNQYARQLNRDVADLILASYMKVSPVQSLTNRIRRRGVQKRLKAEFAQPAAESQPMLPEDGTVQRPQPKVWPPFWTP